MAEADDAIDADDRQGGATRSGPALAALPSPATDRSSPALIDAENAARRYAYDSRSAATWRAYRSDWSRFESWCGDVGRAALPASAATVAAFLGAQAELGRAASTLTRRLAAIRLVHLGAGHASPHDALVVQEVMRGIRSAQRDRPSGAKAALVDTDIVQLVDTLDAESLAGCRDRALLLIGFAGALRRSELVGIDIPHLAYRPQGLLLTIPFSKTDQTGDGETIALPAMPGSPHCPVAALDAWLERGAIDAGPVFRRLVRGPAVSSARLADGSVAALIKRCARLAGFGDVTRFSGHSLRRGFITTAARQRADPFRIAAQSRHRSLETVRRYVEAERRFDDHPGAGMFDRG